MSRAPASQRSSRNVAAAIFSGTLQPAGSARAISPDKPTHTITPATAPTAVMIATWRNLFAPRALPLGQALQARAGRVHPLDRRAHIPDTLLLGRIARLPNLVGERLWRQLQSRVRLDFGQAGDHLAERRRIIRRRPPVPKLARNAATSAWSASNAAGGSS